MADGKRAHDLVGILQDFDHAVGAKRRKLLMVTNHESSVRQELWRDQFAARSLPGFLDNRPVELTLLVDEALQISCGRGRENQIG